MAGRATRAWWLVGAAMVASGFGVVPGARALPARPPVLGGEAHYEATSGRYSLPTLGPIRLVGTFVVGEDTFTGRVDGTRVALDTATISYRGIELSTAGGRLSGTCTASSTALPGKLVGEQLTFDCDVRLEGHAARPLAFVVRAVGHTTEGDPTYGIQTTTSDGVFTGR
jgi:hypothetical protein